MNLLKLFKKEPLWKTDFDKFCQTCTEQQLSDYCDTLPKGKEFDYQNQYWSHTFETGDLIGKFIRKGHGFHTTFIGNKRMDKGDIILLKMDAGKTGTFLILDIRFERDPNDMFWAYVVCTGSSLRSPSPHTSHALRDEGEN